MQNWKFEILKSALETLLLDSFSLSDQVKYLPRRSLCTIISRASIMYVYVKVIIPIHVSKLSSITYIELKSSENSVSRTNSSNSFNLFIP